jgi:hypothetical protein
MDILCSSYDNRVLVKQAVIFTPTVILQLLIAFAILECRAAHGFVFVIMFLPLMARLMSIPHTTDGTGMYDGK